MTCASNHSTPDQFQVEAEARQVIHKPVLVIALRGKGQLVAILRRGAGPSFLGKGSGRQFRGFPQDFQHRLRQIHIPHLDKIGQRRRAAAMPRPPALIYGYETPESFSRAFEWFHGVLQSKVRVAEPKSFFRLTIKVT